jgi:hypothetical protein
LILAQAQRAIASVGLSKTKAFWLLSIVTSVGLGLGRIASI